MIACSSMRVSTCLPLGPRVLGGMMTASPLGSVGPEAAPCGIAGSSGALALAERSELGRARLGSARWLVCWRRRRVLVQRKTPEPVGQPGFRSSTAAMGLVAMAAARARDEPLALRKTRAR